MKTNTNLDRIIAKIDNDFNPDNSDWIPRVGVWTIEVLSMLKCLRTETKRTKLPVKERIVYGGCCMFDGDFKVYDNNGCQIKELNKSTKSCCSCNDPSTGDLVNTDTTGTTDFVYNGNAVEDVTQAVSVNSKDYPSRYNVVSIKTNKFYNRNYVKLSSDRLELNFDTNCVEVEYKAIVTYSSPNYGCELPVIPNNGLLIETIAYYCLYKMLCRGYKHPVFNLHASQYGTNPYYIYMQLKDQAKRSVMLDKQGDIEDDNLWQSSFFINTFNPRK